MATPGVFRGHLSQVTPALATAMDAVALTQPPPVLGVDIRAQDGDFWCWAAVSVGIIAFVTQQPRLEQCQFVKIALQHVDHDCCDTKPPRAVCDVDNRLEVALAAGGVTATALNKTLLFNDVREQIRTLHRPVGALITFPDDNVNHFVEIDGVIDDVPQQFIVNDSRFGGPKSVAVDKFTFNYADRNGTWSETYLIS